MEANRTYTLEYWKDYESRLKDFISYYKKNVSKKSMYENIDFCIETERFNEKVGSLYGELDRVKTIISVLRYNYDTDEIQ